MKEDRIPLGTCVPFLKENSDVPFRAGVDDVDGVGAVDSSLTESGFVLKVHPVHPTPIT